MEAERFYDTLPDIDGAVEALKKIAKSEWVKIKLFQN